MMREIVLVTEKEYRKAEAIFRAVGEYQIEPAPADEQRLAGMVARHAARAVIVGVERYEGPLYESLRAAADGQGSLIARFGVGHDGIDKPLARRHGIIVANTPGALDISVAEHAMWLIGAAARKICRLESKLRAGEFEAAQGVEVRGKTLVVAGFGAIGRRVAQIAGFGFGMKVIAADCMSPAELESREGLSLAEILAKYRLESYSDQLDSALARADYVSIHVAANEQTKHLFNAARLDAMKRGSVLANTSRGSVVDESALFDALASGRLSAAALDVYENEPYRPVSPGKDLRTLERAVLTPHVGSNTAEANHRMARACLENVANFHAGKLDKLTRVEC